MLAAHQADGTYTYNPDAGFVLQAGAKLLVLGELEDVERLRAGLLDGSFEGTA